MSFGQRLRMARKAAGFTQKTLSEKVGVSASAVANYETGVSFPNEDILINLMNVLDIDANYLYADDLARVNREHYLSPEEEHLIALFRQLNASGRQMAIMTIESYVSNKSLTQETESSVS